MGFHPKIEKPYGQMLHMHTFVVTNMDSSPEDLIRFYCKRGQMENFIKECKSGFDMSCVSSSSMIVNANRVQMVPPTDPAGVHAKRTDQHRPAQAAEACGPNRQIRKVCVLQAVQSLSIPDPVL